jgi:hypothetical protein
VIGVKKGDMGDTGSGSFGANVALHGGVCCKAVWQTAWLKNQEGAKVSFPEYRSF